MSRKKNRMITIDEDIDLLYRTKYSNINISGFINDILRQHSRIDDENFEEENILIEELNNINSSITDLEKKRIDISLKLSMLKTKEEQKHKYELEKVDVMSKTMRNSGVLKDMI